MGFLPPTVYDPARVLVTWGGLPIIGYGPGRFVTARRDRAVWKSVDGTHGEMARIRSRVKTGTIEVVLRSTSPTNRALGVLMKTDETTGNIVAPFVVTDTINGSLHASLDAYLEGYPEASYGRQEGDTVWRFKCKALDMQYSGFSVETLVRNSG